MIRGRGSPGLLSVHTHRSILTKPSTLCLHGFRDLPCTSYHRATCEGPYQRFNCDTRGKQSEVKKRIGQQKKPGRRLGSTFGDRHHPKYQAWNDSHDAIPAAVTTS